MRLAEDERARVPFALIGVLLVVGSLVVVSVQFDDGYVEQDVSIAGDRAEAAAETALRDATREAGAMAAAAPVVETADTPYGEILDEDRPYRSYVELLVAVELRERADGLAQHVDGADASLSLDPIEDPESAADAMASVTVEDNGTGVVEVTVEDLQIDVERAGTTVDSRTRTVSTTVATPALTLHDRVEAFQDGLDGGVTESGSLSRSLTGTLYGLGWARGLGQYAGLPIDDVIANRHVELATNLGLLDAQRSTFGDADRAGETDLAAAAARVVANETVGFEEGGLADAALPEPNQDEPTFGEVASPPTRTTVVGVNDSADRALADVVGSDGDECWIADDDEFSVECEVEDDFDDGDDPDDEYQVETAGVEAIELGEIVEELATVEAELVTATGSTTRHSTNENRPAPGLINETTEGETVSVDTVVYRSDDGPTPSVEDPWSIGTLETMRVVEIEETELEHTLENGSVVEDVRTTEYTTRVGVGMAVRAKELDWVPERPLDDGGDLHEHLIEDAWDELLDAEGDVLDVAEDLVDDGTTDPSWDDEVALADLQDLETQVYADLADLRDRLRPIDTEVEEAFVLTDANPAEELADHIDDRRSGFVRVPNRYDGLEERAKVALRSLYLDRTAERIEARSEGHGETQSVLEDKIDDVAQLPSAGLSTLLDVGLDYVRPDPAPLDADAPASDLHLTVDGDPGYLELEEVNRTAVPPPTDENGSYYPLAAKTSTIGSLPVDDVVDSVVGFLVGSFFDVDEKAPLPVAARSLQGAAVLPVGEDAATERESLRAAVGDGVECVESTAASVVAAESSVEDEDDVVETALSRWDAPAERAIAFDDGRAVDAIAEELAERGHEYDADRTRTMLVDEIADALADEDTHVSLPLVEDAVDWARNRTEEELEELAHDGIESATDALESRFGHLPVVPSRGFPIVPFPGWWVATGNVWHVEVGGSYAGFTLRSRQGGPNGGGHVSYVRDGGPAAIDLTGDGSPERLGESTRVSFETSTTVGVVVPRGGGGVGNGDADWEETSEGWSDPDEFEGMPFW